MRAQSPVATGSEAAELQRPECHPLELPHRMPDGLAHPPHLAVTPLVDRHLEQVGRQPPDVGGRRHPILQLDALTQLADGR